MTTDYPKKKIKIQTWRENNNNNNNNNNKNNNNQSTVNVQLPIITSLLSGTFIETLHNRHTSLGEMIFIVLMDNGYKLNFI